MECEKAETGRLRANRLLDPSKIVCVILAFQIPPRKIRCSFTFAFSPLPLLPQPSLSMPSFPSLYLLHSIYIQHRIKLMAIWFNPKAIRIWRTDPASQPWVSVEPPWSATPIWAGFVPSWTWKDADAGNGERSGNRDRQ